LIFDEVTEKNKLAPFLWPTCKSSWPYNLNSISAM